jgi:hypothetical protein
MVRVSQSWLVVLGLGAVVAMAGCRQLAGYDLGDAPPTPVPSGGVGPSPLAGKLHVFTVGLWTDAPAAGVLIYVDDGTLQSARTDSVGQATFEVDAPTVRVHALVESAAESRAIALTLVGVDRSSVTIPISQGSIPVTRATGTIVGAPDGASTFASLARDTIFGSTKLNAFVSAPNLSWWQTDGSTGHIFAGIGPTDMPAEVVCAAVQQRPDNSGGYELTHLGRVAFSNAPTCRLDALGDEAARGQFRFEPGRWPHVTTAALWIEHVDGRWTPTPPLQVQKGVSQGPLSAPALGDGDAGYTLVLRGRGLSLPATQITETSGVCTQKLGQTLDQGPYACSFVADPTLSLSSASTVTFSHLPSGFGALQVFSVSGGAITIHWVAVELGRVSETALELPPQILAKVAPPAGLDRYTSVVSSRLRPPAGSSRSAISLSELAERTEASTERRQLAPKGWFSP